MLGREGGEAVAGPAVGRDLGAEVTAPLGGGADVGEDEVLHVAVDRPRPVDPDRRQPEPLAVDLGHRAVAPRGGAPDIRPVRAHAAEPEEGAVDEGGRHDVDVREVRAPEVRVVVDEDVARLDVVPRADHRPHRVRHRAEVDRQVRPLRDHAALGVEDPARVVARDLEDG